MSENQQEVRHVCDQSDQPYGSVRRCCNFCGIMISSGMLVYAYEQDWWKDPNRCTYRDKT